MHSGYTLTYIHLDRVLVYYAYDFTIHVYRRLGRASAWAESGPAVTRAVDTSQLGNPRWPAELWSQQLQAFDKCS